MPKKRRDPKFSGPLAEPIYLPAWLGVPDGPEYEENWKRVRGSWVHKSLLLLNHYRIERSDPDCWRKLSFNLALDFIPGMQLESSLPPGPGRKRTWQAGLGAKLLRAVEHTMQERSLGIEAAIEYLRKSDDTWRPYTPQNLAARLREHKRRSLFMKKQIAELLAAGGPLSLARLGAADGVSPPSAPKNLMGGLFGIEESTSNPPARKTDGNTDG
jgi:hypothetical protein